MHLRNQVRRQGKTEITSLLQREKGGHEEASQRPYFPQYETHLLNLTTLEERFDRMRSDYL